MIVPKLRITPPIIKGMSPTETKLIIPKKEEEARARDTFRDHLDARISEPLRRVPNLKETQLSSALIRQALDQEALPRVLRVNALTLIKKGRVNSREENTVTPKFARRDTNRSQ